MNYYGKPILLIICAFILVTGAFFINPLPIFSQEKDSVTTEVTHEPIEYFVSGNRILLDAEVTDDDGIELVRCYFKAQGEADVVFVKTENFKKDYYRAILPSPADYTDTIEYLFLVVNKNKQVIKTQIFIANRNNEQEVPDWQHSGSEGDIAVYTELAEAPETIKGFSDSFSIDVVESSARFGMVSGIYSASAMASSGGSAAAATSAGTVTAGAGVSATTVVAAGTAVAAAAAGTAAAAAAAGGGGGGGSDEKLNSLASISWGDADTIANDEFHVMFGDNDYGEASEMTTKNNLPVGDYDLTITCTSTSESDGNYTIILAGGAIFKSDNSTRKEGILTQDESRTYQVHIPELADTTINW